MRILNGIEKCVLGVNIHFFSCSKGDFYAKNNLAMLNVLNAPQKKRQGIGASCSVLLFYLHPVKLISYWYPNKDNCSMIDGIIINHRGIIRVTIRDQPFIFCWVRVIREVIETNVLEDSEVKEERGGFTVESDAIETMDRNYLFSVTTK